MVTGAQGDEAQGGALCLPRARGSSWRNDAGPSLGGKLCLISLARRHGPREVSRLCRWGGRRPLGAGKALPVQVS